MIFVVNRKLYTLYEGECEKSVIEWLKLRGFKFGRTYKVVLSDIKKIERSLNIIQRGSIVNIIMDTDTFYKKTFNKERFKSNIFYLIKTEKQVRIITQDKNLENELVRALGLKNEQQLYKHFDAEGKTEYKSKLANSTTQNLDIKFKFIDLKLFWNSKTLNLFFVESEIVSLNNTLNDIL